MVIYTKLRRKRLKMTTLTKQLAEQLQIHKEDDLIKDLQLDQWFTGQQLADDVATLHDFFQEIGLMNQDLALVCLDNSAVYPVLTQAFWQLGVVEHPVAATTPIAQLLTEFNEHTYAVIVVKQELADQLTDQIPLQKQIVKLNTNQELTIFINTELLSKRPNDTGTSPNEEDLGLILNTSGTTGKPKRVGLTHRILNNAAHHNIDSHKMTSADTTLITMPMFHINAQVISTLSTRLSGGKIVIANKFSASHFWQQISENQVTWTSVVPTIISILLINDQANHIYSELKAHIHLRFVRSSSFALPESKFIAFQDRFHTKILEGYGMTETSSQSTLNPINAQKIGSAGKPVGTDVAILIDGKYETKGTAIGEIVVRGDHVISDYVDPQPNAFHDGWFLTGDLGYFDEDGYLFVKGRSKDMINRGGEKVAPAGVQSILSQLDFIEEIVILGMPDDLYGEAVTAVVKPKNSLLDEATMIAQLQDYANENLAKFERPTQIYFVQDFPRNPTGKILRPQLKKQLLSI